MNIIEIIEKKKQKKSLSKEEIEFFITNYVSGKIKDYQASALSMAILINGMNITEAEYLTRAMLNSGETISLKNIKGIKVDKHSTGGIGDKTTLVISPILASLGLKVAKMSGRGLGFTGGTIDKLESIPGYNCFLSSKQFVKQVNQIGVSVIGQTKNLVPADKKFYALRDVTGTINSLPLIVSSIMSKKLAVGTDAILLDVKVGNGAFMKNYKDAYKLSKWMIEIGKKLSRNVQAEITNMDTPLGKAIGNKNEVLEAIDTLSGKGPKDFTELVYSACARLLVQTKKEKSFKKALKLVEEAISSGRALEKFKEWIKAQGGNVDKLFKEDFWKPKYKVQIKSSTNGYLQIISAVTFGLIAMKLGAGRIVKEDNIDYDAGIQLLKKTNDYVNKGDVLFEFYSSKPIPKEFTEEIKSAFVIRKQKVKHKIILGRVH